MGSNLAKSLLVLGFLVLQGCASSPEPEAPSDVLEPVEEVSTPEQPSAPTQDNPSEFVDGPPEYRALTELLHSLGYQGVGLQYESPEVLQFLQEVFRDPRAAGLSLKRVYTGLEMAYDTEHQSLTVGGTRDKEAVIAFLLKHSRPR